MDGCRRWYVLTELRCDKPSILATPSRLYSRRRGGVDQPPPRRHAVPGQGTQRRDAAPPSLPEPPGSLTASDRQAAILACSRLLNVDSNAATGG